MPLDLVRDQLIEATGRADLNTPGMALGADFFLNIGQRMLDRMLDGGKSFARYFVDVDLQQILVPLASCRAVKKVFCSDGTSRWELNKIDVGDLREYFSKPKTSLDSDKPSYYSPIWVRPFPGIIDSATFNQEWALDDIIDIGHEGFNAILIMPPSDSASLYTLEVLGLFYSDELVNDGDVSFWTEQHPEMLIKAAAYQMEVFYRNTEGSKDWMNAINLEIAQLNSDIVEEEIAEISEMEG